MELQTLNNQTFDAVISAKGAAMVDFFAPWCAPCRTMAPVVQKAAETLGNTCPVYQVNIDASPELATRYQVASIPTIIVFRDGREIHRVTGIHSAGDLTALLP